MAKSIPQSLPDVLAKRFRAHRERHAELDWDTVAARLASHPAALKKLAAMEDSGGEPDVIGFDSKTGQLTFCDCSAETPAGRRSLCYDDAALASRKANKPAGSALATADRWGITLLDESQYATLQRLGEFDRKTSSWLLTPKDVRSKGGALFGDRRFGRVFTYHNGAESYYAARGFRGMLVV
jgi:hypothetical protein